MDLKELGQRLRKLRLDKHPDKSLVEFEDLSGVSRGSIQKIENGDMPFGPGVVTIEKWLIACGTSLREFFGAPSSADFKDLPFKFLPQDTPWHQMLSDILEIRDPDLSLGIYINLREISRTAREIKLQRTTEEKPADSRQANGDGRPKRHPKVRTPKTKRMLRHKHTSGQEQTGT